MPTGIYKRYKNKIYGMKNKHHSSETRKNIGIANSISLLGNIPWNKGLKGFMAGEKNGMWKGKVKKICQTCKNEYEVYPVHKDTTKYCSRRCAKLNKKQSPELIKKRTEKCKGENHYNWKGGISKTPYPFKWTYTLKESIRQKDEYKCQSCGCPQVECLHALDIHHIDEDKSNLNPTNLISLCKKCHGKVQRKVIKL